MVEGVSPEEPLLVCDRYLLLAWLQRVFGGLCVLKQFRCAHDVSERRSSCRQVKNLTIYHEFTFFSAGCKRASDMIIDKATETRARTRLIFAERIREVDESFKKFGVTESEEDLAKIAAGQDMAKP